MLCRYSIVCLKPVLKDEDYIMLRHKLEGLMRNNEDSIIFYRQCNRCEGDITQI